MSMPGPMELAVIALVVLVVFGPARLPQLGRSLGSSLKEFKQAVSKINDEVDGAKKALTEEK